MLGIPRLDLEGRSIDDIGYAANVHRFDSGGGSMWTIVSISIAAAATLWLFYNIIYHRIWPWESYAAYAVAQAISLIFVDQTLSSKWIDISVFLFDVFLAILFYRRNRRNGKKIRKVIGEKAKALLASLVEHARKLGEGVRQPIPVYG